MQSQIESVIERPELETEEDGENSREMDANGDLLKYCDPMKRPEYKHIYG